MRTELEKQIANLRDKEDQMMRDFERRVDDRKNQMDKTVQEIQE